MKNIVQEFMGQEKLFGIRKNGLHLYQNWKGDEISLVKWYMDARKNGNLSM